MKLLSFVLAALVVQVASDCSPIVTIETGKTPSKMLYVAAGASGGDGSSAKPFGTINEGLSKLTPGTALVVRSGDYSLLPRQYISGVKGTEAAPIWIGGEAGQSKPVFGNSRMSEVFKITDVEYLIFHDIEIKDAQDNGINSDDGSVGTHHIVMRDLLVRNIGSSGIQNGIKLSGLNYFWVHDSVISGTSTGGSCIDNVGCHYGLIFKNKFSGGGNGVQTKGGSFDVEMRENFFEGQEKRAVNLGGNTGSPYFRPALQATGNFEGKNLRAVANYFTGANDAIVGFPGCVECIFAHNTVVHPNYRIVRILQETTTNSYPGYAFLPSSKGQIFNNIFQYKSSKTGSPGAMLNVGADTDAGSYTWSNNLWFDSDNPSNTMKPGYSSATGEIFAKNPLIATIGDVKLSAGSPAIGAGKAQTTVKADYYQQCYSATPSIGAWEANAAPSPPTPGPVTPPTPTPPTPGPVTPTPPTPGPVTPTPTPPSTGEIIEFKWTSIGAKVGSCIQITEPKDPHKWTDNYLCALNEDISSWHWTNSGFNDSEWEDNFNWIQFEEKSDPNGWDDNFLGIPATDTRKYAFSSAGKIPSMTCVRTREGADPNSWRDNWFCTSVNGNGVINVGANGVYNNTGPHDEDSVAIMASSASILAINMVFFAIFALLF